MMQRVHIAKSAGVKEVLPKVEPVSQQNKATGNDNKFAAATHEQWRRSHGTLGVGMGGGLDRIKKLAAAAPPQLPRGR